MADTPMLQIFVPTPGGENHIPLEGFIRGGRCTFAVEANVQLTDQQAMNSFLVATGTGGYDVVLPKRQRAYFIKNSTSGNIQVKGDGTTGVQIATTKVAMVVWTGSDYELWLLT